MEKEASLKGIPLGQTLDIDIPPPRPKRKPSNPYPRKTCVSTNSSPKEGKGDTSSISNSSSSPNKEEILKRPASEKWIGNETGEKAKEARENGSFSEILTLFQDTQCSSSNMKNRFKSPIIFREFVPLPKEAPGKNETDKMNGQENEDKEIPEECDADLTNMTIGRLKDINIGSHANVAQEENRSNQSDTNGSSMKKQNSCEYFTKNNNENDGQSAHTHTRSDPHLTNYVGAQMNPNPFTHPPFSGTSINHSNQAMPFLYHQLPTFPPPISLFPNNQDAYKSLFSISSTFSNLIVSGLLQNPSAHAAATFAASFWPNVTAEKPMDAPPTIFSTAAPGGNDNSTPNLASMAAATVAAATAWWATHGLLPLWHHPLSNAFCFGSSLADAVPITMASKPQPEHKDALNNNAQMLQQQTQQVPDADSPEAVLMQRSTSKSTPSSDTEGSGVAERSQGHDLKSSVIIELDSTTDAGLHESSSNMLSEPKKGPCSCASNKLSSTTHGDREKVGDCKQELELSTTTHALPGEINSRRSRSGNYVGESWKEVSEEGRLAFQALFSREVLPQSFFPPTVANKYDVSHINKNEHGTFAVDLNSKLYPGTEPDQICGGTTNGKLLADAEPDQIRGGSKGTKRSDDRKDDSILSSGVPIKLKTHRTGFKPYKRCSMEATVARMGGEEEKSNKRLHIESKASNL